jgi:hypothetical protein
VNQAVVGRWNPPSHVKRAVMDRIVLRAADENPNVGIRLFAFRIFARMDAADLENELAALTVLQRLNRL